MSSVGGTTSHLRGSYGVVGPTIGQKQERNLVDESSLSEEEKEALEADDFIIYGKASVEQYDEDTPSQKLEMEVFEGQLGSFIEDGVISRRHKDIKVGEPLWSYTLEDPTEMNIGGETYEFEAGDELETGIRDDELWIVANIKNDSEFARDTRIGAMNGVLDGFSVTVFCKEWENTPQGQRVTDFDWHSVTIGADEQIKNKDSRFDVAAFKGDFDLSPHEEDAVVEILANVNTKMSDENNSEPFWQKMRNLADEKLGDGSGSKDAPPEDSKEETQGDGPEDPKEDYDYEEDEGEEKQDGVPPEEDEGEDDVDKVMEQVKQEIGEDAADTIRKAMDEVPAPPEEDEDEDYEMDEGELKSIAGKLAEAGGFVTADSFGEKLDERLDEKLDGVVHTDALEEKLSELLPEGDVASKEDVQSVADAAEKAITQAVPDIVEGTAEKMEVAGTPSPSQGSDRDQSSYMEQIQEQFGSAGAGE